MFLNTNRHMSIPACKILQSLLVLDKNVKFLYEIFDILVVFILMKSKSINYITA